MTNNLTLPRSSNKKHNKIKKPRQYISRIFYPIVMITNESNWKDIEDNEFRRASPYAQGTQREHEKKARMKIKKTY